jgi:hypothetical protein
MPMRFLLVVLIFSRRAREVDTRYAPVATTMAKLRIYYGAFDVAREHFARV